LRWVWRHPLIRAAILLITVSNPVFQILVLTLVVLAQHRGATSTTIGMMLGIYSGGGLIGALAASMLHRRFRPRTVIVGVNWIWAALLPLFALTSSPLLRGAIGAACAFVGPLWNVAITTYATALVPNELLGRVTSAAMTLSSGVMPVASLGARLPAHRFRPHRLRMRTDHGDAHHRDRLLRQPGRPSRSAPSGARRVGLTRRAPFLAPRQVFAVAHGGRDMLDPRLRRHTRYPSLLPH
jgi:hypothetical protein